MTNQYFIITSLPASHLHFQIIAVSKLVASIR